MSRFVRLCDDINAVGPINKWHVRIHSIKLKLLTANPFASMDIGQNSILTQGSEGGISYQPQTFNAAKTCDTSRWLFTD
jgi:hypothetical protein